MPSSHPGPRSFGRGRRAALSLIAASALALFGSAAVTATAASAAARVPSASARTAAAHPVSPRPASAAPQYVTEPHAAKLPSGVRQACATPSRPGQMTCMDLMRTNVKGHVGVVPDLTPAGYGPSDLQSAYNLASASSSDGTGATVAVVDAYDDPDAAPDLAVYRSQYGLAACDTSTGAGCVTVVNQEGAASPLPPVDPTGTGGWEAEESTDLDMVSAVCPNCHIMLVEANTDNVGDLGTAENYAAANASFVSNSWGSGGEFTDESAVDSVYFDHPGVAETFAAGDAGYGVQYPAASQFVTSVGGTTLERDASTTRGWSETAWSGTGSGCSAVEPKADWQARVDDTSPGNFDPNGCLNRTDNDVSAVADPNTPVAIYDTYPQTGTGALPPGWAAVGGTSVSAPIIASAYALAGKPAANSYPAEDLYLADPSNFNDVTSGSNGTCESNRKYLCSGESGYDGPTGFGTPDGIGAFKWPSSVSEVVTVKDPGDQSYAEGQSVSLQLQALDTTSGQTLTYSAVGLPSGLSINSSTGLISGTIVSEAQGTYEVQATATDTNGLHDTAVFNMVVVAGLAGTDSSGEVPLDLGGKCLDDANDSSSNGNKIQIWACLNDASQTWKFNPGVTPGGAGTLTVAGKCADIANQGTAPGSKIQLWSCTGGANQEWFVGGGGELINPVSGLCLDDPGASTSNGTQVDIAECSGATSQAWTLPASEVLNGVYSKCLDDANDSSSNGNKIQIWACLNDASQKLVYEPDGTIRVNGKCLDVTGLSTLDGASIQLWACTGAANQEWAVGPNGELINVNSSRCLDDPGDSASNGTQLVQEDCYGETGEVWAVS